MSKYTSLIKDWVNNSSNKLNKPSNNGTNDQILRSNGDGSTRWDNAATSNEIGTAVTSWLNENVTGEGSVVVDETLSVSGAAADAKVVGDEIAALKTIINQLKAAVGI